MDGESETRVETIASLGALEALAPEWLALWARTRAGPFQSPEWLIPWARRFAPDAVHSLALRLDGRLAALVPAFLHRRRDGARQLTLLGNGLSDHLDLIAEPAVEAQAARAPLAGLGVRWDDLDFRDLPQGSALVRHLRGAGLAETPEAPCPALDLAGWPAAAPRKARDNLRYCRRRAEKAGGWRVRRTDAASLEGDLAILARLHGRRWAERGEAGVLDDPRILDFHREAASALEAAGLLRLYVLEAAGAPAAAHYGLQAHGRCCFYLGGFDPALAALSPGALALGHAIEAAKAEGAASFDFLRGREPYKYAWGARDQPKVRMHGP